MIVLCTGSKPIIPPIKGLENITYHTSDTILAMDRLPESIAIVGGGYIVRRIWSLLLKHGLTRYNCWQEQAIPSL